MPISNVVRHYDFSVSNQVIAPDGVQKNGLVVNGAFPGPLIEANWGDWIEITVTNNLPDEGTSLHWHGFLQTGSPWFDGVPSVSQSPIAPGKSLTYKFRADLYGTSWYHSHYSAQYTGGALGPIVVHGPQTAAYDIDIGPVILSDWYHDDYFTIVNITMNGGIPLSNNNLINGKMNYPCANTTFVCTPNAGISKFSFQSGKKYRLRLINTSAEGIQKFTIDGHTFTVIANDFVPINPYTTNVITLGVGQRSDVIVEAVGNSGDAFWMRSELGNARDASNPGCSFSDGISTQAVAAVYYENADTNSSPNTTASWTTAQLQHCGNDDLSLTTALCKITPDAVPATAEVIDITFGSNGTNFVWFMNNSTFRGDYNHALLSAVNQGNLTFEKEWNVFNFGSNSSVQIHVQNHFFVAHPMHLHGHNYHVLAEGIGAWDGTVVNPSNTQRRDVQLMQPGVNNNGTITPSYIVLQWTQDNPSVWPFHCHIAWHVSGGLYVNVLERPDDIQKFNIPAVIDQTASDWNAWTNSNIVDEIDSGL
jgi:FtsP/CotA-like multicopper oxidase with cupredoxin domain